MFDWKLILAVIKGLGLVGTISLPLPKNEYFQFPIEVEMREKVSTEPVAFATRFMTEFSDEPVKCKINIVSNSENWVIGDETKKSTKPSLYSIQYGNVAQKNTQLFILSHEIGHCFDWIAGPAGLSAEGLNIWKEAYADSYAVMVLKRTNLVPVPRLKELGKIRAYGYAEPYREFWNKAILEAASVDVTEKSDKDLLEVASKIRLSVWQQF